MSEYIPQGEPQWEDSYQKRERINNKLHSLLDRVVSLFESQIIDTEINKDDMHILDVYRDELYEIEDEQMELYFAHYKGQEEREKLQDELIAAYDQDASQEVIDEIKRRITESDTKYKQESEKLKDLITQSKEKKQKIIEKINSLKETIKGREIDIQSTNGVIDNIQEQADTFIKELEDLDQE